MTEVTRAAPDKVVAAPKMSERSSDTRAREERSMVRFSSNGELSAGAACADGLGRFSGAGITHNSHSCEHLDRTLPQPKLSKERQPRQCRNATRHAPATRMVWEQPRKLECSPYKRAPRAP